jgi:hypothetical protein
MVFFAENDQMLAGFWQNVSKKQMLINLIKMSENGYSTCIFELC